MRGLRPTRQVLLVGFVLSVLLGAALASATHSQSGILYEAATAIVIPKSETQRERAHTLAEIITLPTTAAAARERGLLGEARSLATKVTVAGDPSAGTLAVVARDVSPEAAAATANAFTLEGIEALAQMPAKASAPEVIEDFELGIGGWNAERSSFGLSPGQIAITGDQPFYGDSALSVECGVQQRCAAWMTVAYPFLAGRLYAATAWISTATGQAPVALHFGSGPRDRALSDSGSGGGGWSRSTLLWTPREPHTSAQFAFESRPGRDEPFRIDGVTVRDLSAVTRPPRAVALSRDEEADVFAAVSRPTFFPARTIGAIKPSGTVWWAFIGAALGALTAGVAFAAVTAASRR